MFDPVEFYYLAENLSKYPDAASARTCINRAYYAAFLAAREKGRLDHTGSNVHTVVREHFKTRNRSVFLRLKDLYILRSDADYRMDKNITNRDSCKAINLAKEILSSLGKPVSAR